MASDDLLGKVRAAVLESGYPFELETVAYLHKHGYHIASSLYFVDKDEDKGRELDIRALLNHRLPSSKSYSRDAIREYEHWTLLWLFIECKRSYSTQWVIFTSPRTVYDGAVSDMVSVRFTVDSGTIDELEKMLDTCKPYADFHRLGRTYTETTGNKSRGNETIYGAISTAVKAAVGRMEEEIDRKTISLYQPMVLFNGRMFESFLKRSEVVVQEVTSALVSFNYQSAKYSNRKFLVPVLTPAAQNSFFRHLDRIPAAIAAIVDQHEP